MKGSIIKRGPQTYQLRLSLGYDDTTGKRKYKHKTVHCTRKEAERRLRDLVAQYEGGQLVVKEDRTSLAKLLEEWLELGKKGEVSETTLDIYRRIIRIYIAPKLGGIPIFRLTAADIRGFYMDLSRNGLGATILRLCATVLKQSLDGAKEEGRIGVNPCLGVTAPKRKREQKMKFVRSFTTEQALQFLAAAKGSRLYMLFKTALLAGMRPGEYLGLTLPNIDWATNELVVDQAMVRLPETKGEFSTTKTEGSRRRIAMPPEFMAELQDYIDKELRLLREFAGDEWQDLMLLFPNSKGGFRSRNGVRIEFKNILRRAGLPAYFRLYDLRHSMATLLLQADENIKVVAERMGHDSPVQTLKTYVHALPSMQKRAATKLGGMFYPGELAA